jgi:hypothetical protein
MQLFLKTEIIFTVLRKSISASTLLSPDLPSTNAVTLQLVKKRPPNNSLMRGLKTVVYSCLMQHYEVQILNKK